MTFLNLAFEIPGYRIIRRLGLGGMATVYLAIQESLTRLVAVKVLAGDRAGEDTVQRFENEARTIARLDHPHIVSIYDVGRTSAGQIYYTMPYLPNGDLATRNLREDPLRVLEIMRALAEALGCAHDQGIVHRDVKPENVLFDKFDRPLLADFGIALSGAYQPRVTREGATIGSSGYMSPEQARGQALDGRSDFYSLGVVCYELLTGEMPFRGPDALAIALAHIEKPVPRLPVTRRVWQPLIDRALAKLPEARFQSAEELLAALEVIGRRLRAPSRAPLPRWWMGVVERVLAVPRRQRALALGGLLLIVLAGLLSLLPHAPERAATAPVTRTPAHAPTPTRPAEGALAQASPAPVAAPLSPPLPALPEPASQAEAAPPAATALEPAPFAAVVAGAVTITAEAAQAARDAKIALRNERLQQAADLFGKGKLIPPGENAAERYLDILKEEPRQADALHGIRTLLAALGARAAKSIEAGEAAAAVAPITQGALLAERARLASSSAFAAFAAPIHHAIEQQRARRHDPFDGSTLEPLRPLVPALAKIDPVGANALQVDLDRPVALLTKGGTFRDAGGPELAIVPAARAAAAHIDHGFAITLTDVTRAAYARFAASRPPSRCRESQRLFARSDGLTWRTPGFSQGDDHPVVCVSWNDADAYARWLGQRTGERYRLPTRAEWQFVAQSAGAGTACGAANLAHHAAKGANCDDGFAQTAPVGHFPPTAFGLRDVAGNVSEWLDGCARAGREDCRERALRGLSWRDDDDDSNLTREDTAASDIGYAFVGFRLVRELPPLPPTAPSLEPAKAR
jgi:serine/threonine-protein kinase PpkA